ncbi:MAG: hypothetical protein MJ057_04085 [Sphaerochaetaceae bacterium]|nr:hypothetical protein [Sphaerochaetaceae bacterium]
MKKILVLAILVALVLTSCSSTKGLNADSSEEKYIFVHGLSGWGSYDAVDKFLPYWGMRTGSLMKYLRGQGFDTYAASVAPEGSAWDRSCELYAQLTGSVVDYGVAHSKAAGHERFGKDFSKDPLIQDFDKSRLVLLGHSFGGITIRVFSDILANGSAEEIAATPESEISPFFLGGQADKVLALVTLATPNSGTTAYDLYQDPSFDIDAVEIPKKYEKSSKTMSRGTAAKQDGRASWDFASYDMHIDNALAWSQSHEMLENVYYFAVPCVATKTENGKVVTDSKAIPSMFMRSSILMSAYTGTTKGGYVIDASWQPNDGLVNTISAKAPIGQPSQDYNGQSLVPGIWYNMPVVEGEHMCLQGGLFIKHKVRPFYLELLGMIQDLVN